MTTQSKGHFGWAVNQARAEWDSGSGKIKVTADLAVRDSGSVLYRMAYQVCVLAKA